ncbi:ATP-dependent DNA helicase RecQ [Evansella sp. AB-rgal1]|uniref:RecQ family ATP-dependent DNA helicase n=1 Tax=Evansella sp. AB-rgal1 TaxID=3242696 RepID=UPI00359E5EC1
MTKLTTVLHEHFGFTEFRPGQEEIITSVLHGKDVLAILPTGGGKTLCYHLPAKLTKGLTLVISPLLSLMEDQVHQLRAQGDKDVVQLNGTLTFEEKKSVIANLNEKTILFISPEMLTNEYVARKLKRIHVGLFVVDEAHCISQWGHEFRTDYLRLKDIKEMVGSPPCFALTATATIEVQEDIISRLSMKDLVVHRFSVNRPQIKYNVYQTESNKEKKNRFFEILKVVEKPAIIYTATRNEAFQLAVEMKKRDYQDVAFYHGGMSKEDRLLVQHQFLRDELTYICCTNAFGMGINKPNVRTVLHYHLPNSIEQYVQEVGRGGRDGNECMAILLYTKEDRHVPISFIEREFPTPEELKVWFQVINNCYKTKQKFDSSIQQLLLIDDTRWKMLLFYLEKLNVLKGKVVIKEINEDSKLRLNHYFQQRKKNKLQRFHQLEQILSDNFCIRTAILNYFGEKNGKSPLVCCSVCGITLKKSSENNRKSMKEPEIVTWQEQLKSILLPSTGGSLK